jgi:beta-N-acetylhexosaminidase
MSDVELVGQLLMPSVTIGDPAAGAVELIARYHLGGVILMGNVENTGSADQMRELTDALRAAATADGQPAGPLTATDQEYGWVTRIRAGIVQLPSAMAFGAACRPDLTEAAWRGAGAELAAAGINVDLAPDADVVDSPGNTVIGSRSYGADAHAVGQQVAAAVRGLQSSGVAATLKHFPGHGHTDVNSHDALPVLRQDRASLQTDDLPPFQAGVAADAWLVMSGHLDVEALDPGVPASFSSPVMLDLLRGQLGFRGVSITDALDMRPAMRWPAGEAAVRAFLAGNDILLMPPDLAGAHRGLLDGVASGRIPHQRLVEAVTRIITLKQRLASIPRSGALDTAGHEAAAAAIAQNAITVLQGACDGPLVRGPVSVTASAGRDRQVTWLADALRAQGVPLVEAGGERVHLVGYADSVEDLAADAAITVSVDTPFLLQEAASPTRLATYSSSQASMRALAAVIAGRAKAPGRSPVPLTGLRASGCAGAP